jgi:soluble lytic murein transglycosylase
MHSTPFLPARIGACRSALAASLALLCAISTGAAAPEDPFAAPRAEFQIAITRVAEASPSVAPADSATLRRYVLYPYLQAARLGQSLGTAGAVVPATLDDQIGAFVRARDGEPVTQDLRRAWLASLAARARWQLFLTFFRDESDSLALRCQAFSARIELQRTEALAADVAKAWLTPRSLPECERAFEWLRSGGGLPDTLVEQRVRLALQAGNGAFARQIALPLPAAQAAPLLQWAALLESPRREIDALIASPGTVVEDAALLAGWSLLARNDRSAAKQRFDDLLRARNLDRRAASPFALALALPLSWDRDSSALRYFGRVDAADFDDIAREWHARAALWAREWKQAARSIAAMSDATRGTARWRYWSARIATHEGEEAAARSLYESLLAEDNYYSAMAAARLKQDIAPNPQPVTVEAAQLASIEKLPPIVRARELRLSGLVDNARAEWRFALEPLPPTARSQAIHLASNWGWHDQAVATASGERVFNDYALLYPRPYDTEVEAAAQLARLPREVIYGVIRQESLYRSDAVSSANARGLMQLLPETARRTARDWKQPAPSATALFEPPVNVVLGAAHLKDLLERFDDQLPVALAGYNAGPNAARRWLPSDPMAPDIWIENIPYNETRAYVQRILWHTVVFRWLENPEPQDTREWLKDLRPVGSAR